MKPHTMTKKQFLTSHRDPLWTAMNVFSVAVVLFTVIYLAHTADDIAALFN
jgi:hypothetical protein